ncbi:NAD-dependent epimerase [uncultured Cyclobacterium sp.]|uniref:NAD-dependent epimerase n=1 Tax=uncultured Cyclobacterium sp. TaxID=453820 RepID=UPI0030EC2EE7
MSILITGTAGFIGMHLAKALLDKGEEVVGLDNINDYYDVSLKNDRLRVTGIVPNKIKYGEAIKSTVYPNYTFYKLNLEDKEGLDKLFKEYNIKRVVNLAAQAGVRYSLTNPDVYIQSNIVGFGNILEACRHNNVEHLTYASSSSIYGLNTEMPFSINQNVDHPVSLYAASKKSNELMAHSYSHLFGLATTGLRFFTVYGPWGRPDMALFLFTKAIIEGKPIDVFNYGEMQRDFTYVDDIVNGVVKVLDNPAKPDANWTLDKGDISKSKAPYAIYNIGNSKPIRLMDFILEIEKCLNMKANLNLLPLQAGDVPATYADTTEIEKELGYRPDTQLSYGVNQFVKWYKSYYKV